MDEFSPKELKHLKTPTIYLKQEPLKWVSGHKYLRVLFGNTLKDDVDIDRQVKSVYIRGNTLVRKFRKCSKEVKVQLFKSYCSNMYASHLWCEYSTASYKRICVGYNNLYQTLLNIRRGDHESKSYVERSVPCFKQLLRSSMFRFYSMHSMNGLVNSILNSCYFICNNKKSIYNFT